MQHVAKYLVLVFLSVTLSACAGASRPELMSIAPDENNSIQISKKYHNAVSIEDVTGGKETNALLMSKVSSEAFQKALENSLAAYGLLNENGSYVLHAELLALEQPVMGFSFTVDSVVDYTLKKNNSVVFKETIKASGKATMGDSPLGVERLRIANEYSIQNNIKAFLEKLK